MNRVKMIDKNQRSSNKLQIDAQGWCPQAEQYQSPNFNARPQGCVPDLLVIHNISLPPGHFGGRQVIDFFCNQLDTNSHPALRELAGVEVSSHFLICRDGKIVQFVSCLERAWHAGVSEFNGRKNCNDFSIGIEVEGSDDCPFAAAQYASLAQLSLALCRAYPLRAVCGHQHIAPGRKTDPGPYFDWADRKNPAVGFCHFRQFERVCLADFPKIA